MSLNKGEIIQTVKRLPDRQRTPRGTRGRVEKVLGQWAYVRLADGRRVQVHEDDVSVILKYDPYRVDL